MMDRKILYHILKKLTTRLLRLLLPLHVPVHELLAVADAQPGARGRANGR